MEAERGKNRNCPKCGHEQAQEWLEVQRGPACGVTYFMVTFTLQENLRKLARRNQKLIYDLLFRTSAAALQKLAWDPEFVGGHIGADASWDMVGVLQTLRQAQGRLWTRDLGVLHPHIHYVVPGGGLSEDGKQWKSKTVPAKEFISSFLQPACGGLPYRPVWTGCATTAS